MDICRLCRNVTLSIFTAIIKALDDVPGFLVEGFIFVYYYFQLDSSGPLLPSYAEATEDIDYHSSASPPFDDSFSGSTR